jgi:alpha-beta hydrolase superfamily lysophospholipase
VAERYVSAGFICVLVDLPAHGESTKTRTNYGYMMSNDILLVTKEYVDVYNQPIYFWGMSLGGRYAITSAQPVKKMFPEPKALILVSTFDKLSYVLKEKSTDLFGDYMGKILYKSLAFSLKTFYNFVPEKIDSATLAQKIKVPVFMLHGKQDKLISYKHGEKLFQNFPSKDKELHLDEKGNHHNILVTEYPFYLESILFLLKH